MTNLLNKVLLFGSFVFLGLIAFSLEVRVKDHHVTQVLSGQRIWWFRHGSIVCGCLGNPHNQKVVCECSNEYAKNSWTVENSDKTPVLGR